MIALRSSEPNDLFEIDIERELEAIHMILFDNAETLKHWKNALEGTELPQGQPALPAALQEQVLNHITGKEEIDNSLIKLKKKG